MRTPADRGIVDMLEDRNIARFNVRGEHGRRQAALRRGAGQKGAPSGTQPRDVGRSSGDVHTKPVPGLGGPVRAAYPMATRLAISVLLLVAIGFFSVGYALMRPARRLALRKEMGDL